MESAMRKRSIWATWLVFATCSAVIAGLSAIAPALAVGSSIESLLSLWLFASAMGGLVSLIPGVSLYVLYEAIQQMGQPKWETDEAGNFILLLGALGPSILFSASVLTFAFFRTNPLEQPVLQYVFGFSFVVTVTVLLALQNSEAI